MTLKKKHVVDTPLNLACLSGGEHDEAELDVVGELKNYDLARVDQYQKHYPRLHTYVSMNSMRGSEVTIAAYCHRRLLGAIGMTIQFAGIRALYGDVS